MAFQFLRGSDLIHPELADFLRNLQGQLLSLLWMVTGGLLLLALLSYNPQDPSWNTFSDAPPTNMLGLMGSYTADFLWQYLGLMGLLIPFFIIFWAYHFFKNTAPYPVSFRLAFFPVALFLLALPLKGLSFNLSFPVETGPAGLWGYVLHHHLWSMVTQSQLEWSWYLLLLLSLSAGVWSLCYSFDITREKIQSFAQGGAYASLLTYHGLVWAFLKIRALIHRWILKPSLEERFAEEMAIRQRQKAMVEAVARPKKEPSRREQKERQPTLSLPVEEGAGYQLPPLHLLAEPEGESLPIVNEDALSQNARLLEGYLQEFGVKGQITKVRPGPVVTLYELEPAPGTKTSRIIGLADDIARSMSALSVRIAVIPGRNVVGIELPNLKRQTVSLKTLVAANDFNQSSRKLTIALGKDIGGGPIYVDLTTMPHMLIAGTTGSGKSVAVNTMILSLLYRLTPNECRFIMVDPKMLELSVYDGIPHLLAPVVTDPHKAVVALKWAVREMEERYRNMSQLGVRNIDGYNKALAEAAKKGEQLRRRVQTGFDPETGRPVYEDQELDMTPIPYIVVIVDEMADLMLVAGKEVEAAIQRLAQMARAAGIHLIMATQRPSVDVITGTIKANFPVRISFQVTSKIDSRTILGEQGAEQLLGRGDMLYMAAGGRISRVHGPFVSDKEVETIVSFLRQQEAPAYGANITEDDGTKERSLLDTVAGFDESMGADKDLYQKAVAIILEEGKVSTSFIQRQLRLGYNRAADIIDRMEREGIISKPNHVGKREILKES